MNVMQEGEEPELTSRRFPLWLILKLVLNITWTRLCRRRTVEAHSHLRSTDIGETRYERAMNY